VANIYQTAAYHAARRPQAVAIADDARALGFAALADLALRQARQLAALGVQRGDRVCVILNTSIDHVALYHATAVTGFILVPVNVRFNAEEVAWILGDVAPKAVVFDAASAGLAAEARLRHGSPDCAWHALEEFRALPAADLPGAGSVAARYGSVDEDEVALIIYTSGTTSRPKGAMLTHGNLVWNAVNYQIELGIDKDAHSLLATPLYHIGGFGVLNGPVLYAGGRLTVIPRFDVQAVVRAMADCEPTHLFLLSAMWVALTEWPGFAKLRHPGVRFVQTAASPLAEHRQEMIRRVFPNAEFSWGFGMTETCVTTIKNRYTAEILSHPGSLGYLWRHVAARLVDESGAVLPGLSGPGELQVRGPTVFKGYWRNPEATAAAFTADGWMRTGDLIEFDADGFARFRGRSKDIIKTGGENVSAAEVEECLVQHAAVSEAAVYGVPHDYWGEEVRAAVVAAEGHAIDVVDLQAFCKSRLAGFKVPKQIAVVGELPRSASGKVQKFRLAAAAGTAATR